MKLSFLMLKFWTLALLLGGLGALAEEADGVEEESEDTEKPLIWAQMDSAFMLKPCNRSREVIQGSKWGRISDGPFNYTQDTTCEWLIKAPPGYWISLKLDRVRTECSYDYLLVLDGDSYSAGRLIASFSGASDPHVTIVAHSGSMLIVLYSDPNYVLEGFQAEYSISPCPSDCSGVGKCAKTSRGNSCECPVGRGGVSCEKVLKENSSMELFDDFSEEPSTRLVLSSSSQSPFARTAHTVINVKNLVYVFGGYDLNNVLDTLISLDLETHHIENIKRSSELDEEWPLGRFSHSAERYKDGFFIHGGKLGNGTVSSDLFYFNASSRSWRKIPSENLRIPALMYHSMTATSTGDIFVYGGSTGDGEFTANLYKFRGESPSNWSLVKSLCCGKEASRALLGHSMTYWEHKNALILFGGLSSSDYGRFSKLSANLWMFLIDSSTWLHLDYRKNGGVPHGVNPERAFHTAHIVEGYLTVFGGYQHVHNKDETCYSNQLLVYNLECQTFLPIQPSSSMYEYKPTQGLFSHQSVLYRNQLVIIGGFRGYLPSTLRKIPFPLARRSSDCSSFDRWRCSGEPRCGWCPTNGKCFDKVVGASNCTTNLQTVQCPGLCPLLTTCQSCVIPECFWCGSSQQCWKQSEEGRSPICSNPLDNSAQFNAVQCAEKSWRIGATQYEYRFPPNFSNPDSVRIVNSSVLVIPKEYGTSVPSDLPVTFALKGSMVGLSLTNPMRKLELCSLQAFVNLTLSGPEETLRSSYNWTNNQLCYNLTWSNGQPVYLLHLQKIKFDLVAQSFGKLVTQDKPGIVSIQLKYYAGPIPSPRILKKDNLNPYQGDEVAADDQGHFHNHCLEYRSCLPCAGDMACLWRVDTRLCIPRMIVVPPSSSNSLSGGREIMSNPALPFITNRTGLISRPEDCPMCSDLLYCPDCINNIHGLECEWWEVEMSCHRRGRLDTAVRTSDKCPLPCSGRKTCSSCLDALGKCVWCEQKQECFLFSAYTSVYQYGQCYQWVDKASQCKACDKQSSCENCVLNMGCGWSYNDIGGSCTEGDFSGPYSKNISSLDSALQLLLSEDGSIESEAKVWTYGECPDVNECELGLDDCHFNATCVNTPGSFVCFCKPGWTGDGRTSCNRTCEEPCVHGTCSPDFVCECDLGWSGRACSVDCLCNNHSFCEKNGPGSCDECQEHTTGERCQICREGSYGNATLQHVGCTPCHCNGHGDVHAGLCDTATGHCFCLNNTAGRDCSECAQGYYGDPSDSKPCYQGCSGRGVIKGPSGHFCLPPDIGLNGVSNNNYHWLLKRMFQQRNSSSLAQQIEHCMWILQADEPTDSSAKSSKENYMEEDIETRVAGILITIQPGFDIPCSHNVLHVYKGFTEFGVNSKLVPLVAAVCNEKDGNGGRRGHGSRGISLVVEGPVATIVLKYGRMGPTKFAFNAAYQALNDREMEKYIQGSNPFARIARPNTAFNITSLYEGTSPSLSVLSRYGHSLHVDQHNLWIFGGYSLSHGPLNDIRHFSRDSNSWVPLTITVLQSEEAVPPARYFHAAVLGPDMAIYTHGGISGNLSFLRDNWKFDTRSSRWSKFCEGPNESPKLAGHTLTLRSATSLEPFAIIMIGGFNPEEGFSDKVYSIGSTECWAEIETTGSSPIGLYGHSVVHHTKSDTFYVFGGILHDAIGTQQLHGSTSTSGRLFALHWPTRRWSVLSPSEENQPGPYPMPRFLHTAASTHEYMVILGGSGPTQKDRKASMLYVYKCNLWLLLNDEARVPLKPAGESVDDLEFTTIPDTHDVTRVAAATAVWHNELFQMGGWKDGMTSESLFVISTPTDPCSFQNSKTKCKGTVGCAFCSSNNNHSQQCYNAELEMPSECSSGASNIEFWKGVTCSSTWLSQQACGRFNSCTECLATWPSHPNVTQGCLWCTNGKEGKCIPFQRKVDDESPCGQKQWAILDSSQCPERMCTAPQCERCIASAGKCIWTRQILRSRERSWEMRLQPVYDWNCVRKSILETSPSVSVVSSPPASCPIPCWQFDSCQECLESPGAEGGYHQCYWSVNQRRCISPAYLPLLCFGGICGPILKGSPTLCPKSCSTTRSCSSCLDNPSCGWCAVGGENGEGLCISTNKVTESATCANNSKWHYLKCPEENECTNGHHGCDPKSEECIDLKDGYRCQCRSGYERKDTACLPICPEGCVHGICIEPGLCQCQFGYVGQNCSAQCDCNGHSNCAGISELDVCLECKNNTMGPRCAQCKPMFVGDPRNNGACISCTSYCNDHSDVCLSRDDYNKWCNGSNKFLTSSQLMSKILSSGIHVGPSTTAFCCHCKNQTAGNTCDKCINGFFRGYDDKRLPCRKCECNGHGDLCDEVTGNNCNCHNNTESEHCTQNSLKQNVHFQCWKHQCSKCKDPYIGSPTAGHQCYLQMHMEDFYCFDPKTPNQACSKPKPLLSGRMVFLMVQPKFLNVNIRLTLDVTHGSINVYLSPKEDTFVIKQDENNWIHRVEFDTKYGLAGDKRDSIFGKGNLFDGSENNLDYEVAHNSTDDLEELIGVNRIIPKPRISTRGYRYIEQEAAGFATYYTVQDPKAILLVRNLRNRLVITLPQDHHDLRLTRFYLVLEGIGDISYGSIVFRQDQLHIDLFVFFSVFFSAFFLFLSGCGVAWKVRQNMEANRARQRHVAEMMQMAKRPFAVCTVLLQPDQSSGIAIANAYSQCRKSCRKGCICLRPFCQEYCRDSSNAVCTMLISMPGGVNAPIRLCTGSVLANIQRSHGPYHGRRRRLHH